MRSAAASVVREEPRNRGEHCAVRRALLINLSSARFEASKAWVVLVEFQTRRPGTVISNEIFPQFVGYGFVEAMNRDLGSVGKKGS